jgi:hypothetical protein
VNENEIRSAVAGMEKETLADALALLLARGGTPREPVAGGSRPELANFAQAVLYLKKNYDFEELDLFSTEADLVYVQTADRRILLTDRSRESQRPTAPAAAAPGVSAAGGEASKPPADRGRFSNLEI